MWLLAVYYPTYCNTPWNNEIWVTDGLAPAVHRFLAQHQSDNRQAALAHSLTDADAVISGDLIWRETCNPARGRFRQIVEIRPDLDTGSNILRPYLKSDSLLHSKISAGITVVIDNGAVMILTLITCCFSTESAELVFLLLGLFTDFTSDHPS